MSSGDEKPRSAVRLPGVEDVTDCISLKPDPGERVLLCRHVETMKHMSHRRCVFCHYSVPVGLPMLPYIVRRRG